MRETLTKHQAQRANAKTGGLQPGKVYDGRRGRSLLIREPEARPDARPCATHTAAEEPRRRSPTDTQASTQQAHKTRERYDEEEKGDQTGVSRNQEGVRPWYHFGYRSPQAKRRAVERESPPRASPVHPSYRNYGPCTLCTRQGHLVLYQFIVLSRRMGVPMTGRRSRMFGLNGSSETAPDALWSWKPRNESAA